MKRGFSLAETVLALFIMVGAMAVFGLLMHAMLNYGTRAQQRAMAALAAQKKLEEIRDWCNTGNNFFSAWPYVSQTSTDPAYPGVTLVTETAAQQLVSPCTALETKNPSRRTISQSCMKVRVTASWPQDGGQPIRLLTLMCPPKRMPNPVLRVAGAVPATLPARASYGVRVTALDTAGQQLRDVMFQWTSEPTGTNPGNGTASAVNGSGSSGQFTNLFTPQVGGAPIIVPGTCRMGVIAFYRGRIMRGATNVVLLLP